MAGMIRRIALFLCTLPAAVKGAIFLVWDPISPNGVDVRAENYGLDSEGMAVPWSRLLGALMGREPLSHAATNYLVEWFENTGKEGLRRAVKIGAAFLWLMFLAGLGIGLAV